MKHECYLVGFPKYRAVALAVRSPLPTSLSCLLWLLRRICGPEGEVMTGVERACAAADIRDISARGKSAAPPSAAVPPLCRRTLNRLSLSARDIGRPVAPALKSDISNHGTYHNERDWCSSYRPGRKRRVIARLHTRLNTPRSVINRAPKWLERR